MFIKKHLRNIVMILLSLCSVNHVLKIVLVEYQLNRILQVN